MVQLSPQFSAWGYRWRVQDLLAARMCVIAGTEDQVPALLASSGLLTVKETVKHAHAGVCDGKACHMAVAALAPKAPHLVQLYWDAHRLAALGNEFHEV